MSLSSFIIPSCGLETLGPSGLLPASHGTPLSLAIEQAVNLTGEQTMQVDGSLVYVYPKVAQEGSQPVGTVKSLIIEVGIVFLVKRAVWIVQTRAIFGIYTDVGKAQKCEVPDIPRTQCVAEAKMFGPGKDNDDEDEASNAISFCRLCRVSSHLC